MKSMSKFIVEKRYLILAVMLALTVVSAFFAFRVEVNSDMTKYLPDNSSMRQGIDMMEEEFPGLDEIYTIRAMFTGLPENQKGAVKKELEALPYVDSVEYKLGNADYNKEGYTLYIISTIYDFGTAEELAIEAALSEPFLGHEVVFARDTEADTGITPAILIVAVTMLMVILFLMCASWLEPFLFLAAIGVAVLINMGTNIFLGSISEITASISAILQLALSMDYSIILINRYRQELEHTPDKYIAMQQAITNSFASVASSAATTVVGLLMLVFMSFKIGKDLGLVLAKGVAISMFCVFALLPVFILMCDKWIHKTAKKALHIKMDGLANYSYKFHNVIVIAFVVLFVGGYFMQLQTQIAYTLQDPDPIADVFEKTNTVLVLFDNDDEKTMTQIAEQMESNAYVRNAASVSTTIGKPYTSAELADELLEMGDTDMDLNAATLDILYYYYYKNGETGDVPASDFLRFIAEDVANNEVFADYLDDEIRDNLDMIAVFSDKEELITTKNVTALADVFGMEEKDIRNMLVYYYGKYGGAESGSMTLPQFVRFLQDDVLTDPDFGDMLDADTTDMVDTLSILTDRQQVQVPKTAAQIADALDMEIGDVEMLRMLYYANQGAADHLLLTFPQFAHLLLDEVLADERFEDSFDAQTRSDVEKLGVFADKARFQTPQNSKGFAESLGMDAGQADLLYMFYFAQQGVVDQKEMTVAQFASLLAKDFLNDDRFGESFDEESKDQMSLLATFGDEKKFNAAYTSARFAKLLDIKAEMADFLYAFYYTANQSAAPAEIPVTDFVRFLQKDIAGNRNFSSMFDSAAKAGIDALATYTDPKVLLAEYSAAQLARLMGMNQGDAEGLLLMAGVDSMTLSDFIDLLAGAGDPAAMGLQSIKALALSGMELSFVDMSSVVGMDVGTTGALYFYYMGLHTQFKGPGVALYDMVDFIATDLAGSGFGGDELAQISTLKNLMDAALEGEKHTPEDLAGIIGMDDDMMKMLYAYDVIQHGSTARWTVSMQTLIDFVLDDLAEGAFGDSLKAEDLKDLSMTRTLMQSTLSGRKFTPAALADLVDMDADMIKVLYAYHINQYGDTSAWLLSLRGLVDFIIDDVATDEDFGDMLDADMLDDLQTLRKIINGALAGTSYTAEELAGLMDMEQADVRQLYMLRVSRQGDTSGWGIPVQTFIHFIHDDVLADPDLADQINADDTDMLQAARRLVDAVIAGQSYSAQGMNQLFEGASEDLNEDTVKLLYVYYFSQINSDPAWTFSLHDLFNYLLDDILSDPLFADLFDDEMRRNLLDSKDDLDQAIEQLSGPNYSRMAITTTLPGESEDTYVFLDSLLQEFDESFSGKYYLIGTSPMSFEMSQSFDKELQFITILTAISIFIVIAITFRSLIIPALLVLVIQCGVYLTISIIGVQGYSIYYLALLIVQCILMGATIDYGILFTSYYIENRQKHSKQEALVVAYNGSIHTILTSGLIMIVVTGVLGKMFANPTIGQICQTISSGALCATLLIVFILPAILYMFDRWICGKDAYNDHLA